MPLNKNQKTAVEYLDGPLLVLAGPGTGKTQLLSSKVAYILENTDASPGEILCLTYTENGAENMRERLFSIIGPAASKININTYHAFGTTILAEYKNYAESFDRVPDAPINEVTTHKILSSIQKSLPTTDILRGDSINDIKDTIASAKSARLTPDDLEKIAKDNLETSLKIAKEIDAPLKNYIPRMKFNDAIEKVYGPLLSIFAKYATDKPIIKNIDREVNSYLLELNHLVKTEQEKEKSSISPLTDWKNKTFEKDGHGNFRLKNIIANKKLLSLANIMRKYDAYLTEEGLYDFPDMIERAIESLKADKGFRLTLSERFQYILLDEFQDTNPSQAELIYLLTDYENPLVMAVGDDDQAIFAFQGANASNLLEFQAHYNAKVITLTENYRSSQEILDFSHRIADEIESSFAKTHDIDKNLLAKVPQENPEITRDEFLSSDAEHFWIANQIAKLIANGEKQSDIAIITAKHKFIAPLLPYLKSHPEINIAYEKRDNLFEDPKIKELLKLSDFIYALASGRQPSHLLLEILSFPFWELNPVEVIEACKNEKTKSTLDYLTKTKSKSLNKIANFLANLVKISFETPLELFLDYLTGVRDLEGYRCPYLDYYKTESETYETFEFYENLTVLNRHLKDYLKLDNPRLKDLITFHNDYADAGLPLTNTSPYQDSDNAVQIVTVHKSKGLEYKHVFILSADDLAWGKGGGNNNRLSLPKNLIQIRHTGITDDERLRSLFVAITRAKSCLHITNSTKNFTGKNVKRLLYLAETDDGLSPKIIENGEPIKIKKHLNDLDIAKRETDLKLSWATNYQKLTPDLKMILKSRLKNFRISASALTSFIDLAHAGPQEFYTTRILNSPKEPIPEQIAFGNLIHATFERITNYKISDEEAFAFYEAEAKKLLIPESDIKELLDLGRPALEASLREFSHIIRAKNSRAEVDVSHEHLQLGSARLTGKIDHINIDEKNKTLEIYDYKTGKYSEKNWNSNASLYKYRLQLGFYKLLLNLSPTFSKYKITRAHILFVSPDAKDNAVYDKVYEYNEKDEAELKSLIISVYNHIASLDFIEDEKLFLPKNELTSVRQLRDFVKLLTVE